MAPRTLIAHIKSVTRPKRPLGPPRRMLMYKIMHCVQALKGLERYFHFHAEFRVFRENADAISTNHLNYFSAGRAKEFTVYYVVTTSSQSGTRASDLYLFVFSHIRGLQSHCFECHRTILIGQEITNTFA